MDIVEKLRADELPGERQHEREARMSLARLLDEAADEIERLRIEVEALKLAMDEWRIAAMDMRDALIVAQNALLMVTQPDEIERTSSANAYFACVEAEVRARAAIGEWKE